MRAALSGGNALRLLRTDDEALQVELRGDPQRQGAVEGVVVRDERAGLRAASLGLRWRGDGQLNGSRSSTDAHTAAAHAAATAGAAA